MKDAYTLADALHDLLPAGTVRRDGGPLPTTGYYVGAGGTKVCTATREALAEVILNYPDALYYGVWSDDGLVYIDAVDHVENINVARDLAVARGELAIYSITNDVSIVV